MTQHVNSKDNKIAIFNEYVNVIDAAVKSASL
jgi:hypothetical protein